MVIASEGISIHPRAAACDLDVMFVVSGDFLLKAIIKLVWNHHFFSRPVKTVKRSVLLKPGIHYTTFAKIFGLIYSLDTFMLVA